MRGRAAFRLLSDDLSTMSLVDPTYPCLSLFSTVLYDSFKIHFGSTMTGDYSCVLQDYEWDRWIEKERLCNDDKKADSRRPMSFVGP